MGLELCLVLKVCTPCCNTNPLRRYLHEKTVSASALPALFGYRCVALESDLARWPLFLSFCVMFGPCTR